MKRSEVEGARARVRRRATRSSEGEMETESKRGTGADEAFVTSSTTNHNHELQRYDIIIASMALVLRDPADFGAPIPVFDGNAMTPENMQGAVNAALRMVRNLTPGRDGKSRLTRALSPSPSATPLHLSVAALNATPGG